MVRACIAPWGTTRGSSTTSDPSAGKGLKGDSADAQALTCHPQPTLPSSPTSVIKVALTEAVKAVICYSYSYDRFDTYKRLLPPASRFQHRSRHRHAGA